MKVSVAGATGVIGRRVTRLLIEAGHRVTGLARSEENARQLAAVGADAGRVDLFDLDRVRRAVAGHDVVYNLATAIPPSSAAWRKSAWETNHRIRREGSRNLVQAALAVGARRFVQESVALLYAEGGDRCLDEAAPVDPTWITASALDAGRTRSASPVITGRRSCRASGCSTGPTASASARPPAGTPATRVSGKAGQQSC